MNHAWNKRHGTTVCLNCNMVRQEHRDRTPRYDYLKNVAGRWKIVSHYAPKCRRRTEVKTTPEQR